MLDGKRIVCVLPAYNAALTLEKTLRAVPPGIVDVFVLVDDCSRDDTLALANRLACEYPLRVLQHDRNRGYGGNQKTCYQTALEEGADAVVMLHPDYQYEPRLLGALTGLVTAGIYDVALGSRILGRGALAGGMPLYKYVANRLLTMFENLCLGHKLSEYHTGYRVYDAAVLRALPLGDFSDDFVFDNEILVEAHLRGYRIGEISIPTKYFEEASSIGFWKSVHYGFGVLRCSLAAVKTRFGRLVKPIPLPTSKANP